MGQLALLSPLLLLFLLLAGGASSDGFPSACVLRPVIEHAQGARGCVLFVTFCGDCVQTAITAPWWTGSAPAVPLAPRLQLQDTWETSAASVSGALMHAPASTHKRATHQMPRARHPPTSHAPGSLHAHAPSCMQLRISSPPRLRLRTWHWPATMEAIARSCSRCRSCASSWTSRGRRAALSVHSLVPFSTRSTTSPSLSVPLAQHIHDARPLWADPRDLPWR
jgi:hypothetical protein